MHSAPEYNTIPIYCTQPLLLNISSTHKKECLKKFRAACVVINVSISLMECHVVSNKVKSTTALESQFTCSITSSCTVTENLPSSSGPNIPDIEPVVVLPDIENAPVPSFLSVDTSGLSTEFRKLTKIVKKKDSKQLMSNFGGLEGVVRFLITDTENGIHENELSRRRMTFGSNTNKKPNLKRLISLVSESFICNKRCIIFILLAIFSMVFDIIEYGARDGWSHVGSTIIGLFLGRGVLLPLLRFFTYRQLYKLHGSCVKIDVVRNGTRKKVWITDIVVGDVIHLKVGDQVPTDGLCIDGHSLQVDESIMTGKTDHVDVDSVHNPFLLRGSKVVNGSSKMLVTSVGMYTYWGIKTPLQVRLYELRTSLTKVGVTSTLLMFLVLLTHCFNGKTKHEYRHDLNRGAYKKLHTANSVLKIIFMSMGTLLLVDADLELAFEMALVNSLKRMRTTQLEFQNHVSCETMGSVTVICTMADTLTLNELMVTKCWIGNEEIVEDSFRMISPDLLELFYQGVVLNTTCKEHNTNSESLAGCSCSPSEKAILSWAVQCLGMKIDILEGSCTNLHVDTSDQQSVVLIKSKTTNSNHLHGKGAVDTGLEICSSYYQPTGEMKQMTKAKRSEFESIIGAMMESSLHCIAFAHKQFESKEPSSSEYSQNNLSLLGIIGMEHPCRSGAKNDIESYKDAGVDIKMITSENFNTAKRIATGCGILDVNQHDAIGQVIEGAEFRSYTPKERLQKVDNIRVMARSSSLDNLLLVQCLKQKGHVVAVTADGTNDSSALKEADVALFRGREGPEVVKENSDIFIRNNDFSTVATVINMGRCFYTNVQKYIQCQLTITVSSLVINLIASILGKNIPLTIIQSLYVDMIGKLVIIVATVRPLEDLMHSPPVGQTEHLITNVMWINLLRQAIYQIVIQSVSLFVDDTLIFNIYVFCNVCNLFDCMMVAEKSPWNWIWKNKLLLGITGILIIVQVVIVQFLRTVFGTVRLNLAQWGVCVALAGMTLPVGWVINCLGVPKKPFPSYLRDFYNQVVHFLV